LHPAAYSNASTPPNLRITGFEASGATNSSISRNHTLQLTWIKHNHTIKTGGRYRYITGYYSNVFASEQLGM
jgi:hypothetical protein